jgi:hypothetical protein
MTRATHDSPAVRLSTKLPKATDANGLQPIANALLDEPRELRYAVIAYDVARLIDDLDAGTDTAVVRIQRIEPLNDDDSDTARKLLDQAAQTRSGTASLFDNEDGE